MTIQPWIDAVNAQPSEDRLIIALLPDAEGMRAAQDVNRILLPNAHPSEPIIFGTNPKVGVNAVAHMTLLQFNCTDVERLTTHLDNVVRTYSRFNDLSNRDMTLHVNAIGRYEARATNVRTPFAFWWVDHATAHDRVSFTDLVRIVFHGRAVEQLPPCKNFARPTTLSEGLTASERAMHAAVGYSHAGQWHITVAYMKDGVNVGELIGTREDQIHFGHLALGRAGRNGTLVRIIKTWELP